MTPKVYAEFRTEESLRAAVALVSGDRALRLDVHSPYPLPDLEPSLGIERSPIPRWVLLGGLTGAVTAYLIQWYTAAISYPLNVGGRPFHSAPAFIPITFESGILAAALTAFVSVLVRARLVRLYDPVFELDGFERVTTDRFWLSVALASDAAPGTMESALRRAGAARVIVPTRPS